MVGHSDWRILALAMIVACLTSIFATPSWGQAASEVDKLVAKVEGLAKVGQHREAMEAAQKGIGALEKRWGRDDIKTASALYRLGHALRWQSQFASAHELLMRALAIFEKKARGKDDSDVARTLVELGWASVHTLRLKDAEQYFLRALKMNEALFGPHSIQVSWCLDGLAIFYISSSRYDEAERYVERSLKIKEALLDPDDNDTATARVTLATAKFKNGKLSEASELFTTALEAERAKPKPDDLRMADLTGLLAIVSYDRGDYASAERQVRETIDLLERNGGTQRGTYVASFNLLAKILVSTNRYAEGEAAANKVISAYGVSQLVTARDVFDANNTLSVMYMGLDRYAEAEQALKKSLTVAEETFGETSIDVSVALENLAYIYSTIGRSQEALDLFGRILNIRKTILPVGHALTGSVYAYRALVFNRLGRFQEAEADAREGISIVAAAYNDSYPLVLSTLDELGTALKGLGRYDEAITLYKDAIDRSVASEGQKSSRIPIYLHNLGIVFEGAGRLAEAEDAYMRSIAARDTGTLYEAQTRKVLADLYAKLARRSEARDNYRRAMAVFVEAFVKSAGNRQEYEGGIWVKDTASAYLSTLRTEGDDTSTSKEAFEVAQWLLRTSTSTTVSQLGARYAAATGDLAQSVRARQDGIQRWQSLSGQLDRLISKPIGERNPSQVTALRGELTRLETELTKLDKLLTENFPTYAELSSPRPVTADEVQKLLGVDEVLIQFVVLDQYSVAWIITHNKVTWYQLPLGAAALGASVAGIRCGLDFDGAWAAPASRCSEILGMSFTAEDHASGRPLPFDTARAHALYKQLFGEAEQLIEGKHLLVVASGPLTQLPLQVLVENLPAAIPAGLQEREVALLGAELTDLTDEARFRAKLPVDGGVRIVKPVAGGPAELAKLKPDDILLSIGGESVHHTQQAVETVRSQAPRSIVRVAVWRDEARTELDVALGAITLRHWQPAFLSSARDVAWFGRSHAITMLPAVSSLKALRQNAKVSSARKPFLGIGNPLLDGPNASYAQIKEAARQRRHCGGLASVKVAAARTGIASVRQRGGIADVAELRQASPLPETADELCDVAAALGAVEADVLLASRATEREIGRLNKSGELRDFRILHFATHGALAGEASGTAEPGFLLTPPLKGTAADDGYLSATEIAELTLDADWVILSACNTAAGDTKGGQSLSGLARAFFYAGARALLVSHWYVDSNATVALIKGAFNELKTNPKIGRAEALRRSMVALMDSGVVALSHPAAWAPFVVVGEGAR